MSENHLQIAIDGPVASGKGEIAARLAQSLNLLYVYTGAMYRALALACIQARVELTNEQGVLDVLKKITIGVVRPAETSKLPYRVLLNGSDVSEAIQAQDVAQGASDVGVFSSVRGWMVARQKDLAKNTAVVMEGRDIALRVLPNAHIKIYLTASLQERASRRFKQWQEKGVQKTLEETIEDTRIRDLQDSTRKTDPLQKVSDAWEVDTTDLNQDEVVAVIMKELQLRKLI